MERFLNRRPICFFINVSGILIILCLLWGFFSFPVIKFVPLRWESGFRGELVAAPELINDKFIKNIQIVLNYYGKKYTASDMKVYITCNLYLDKELIWNYTNKALDKEFIKMAEGKKLGGDSK